MMSPAEQTAIDSLLRFVGKHRRLLVLTGAGLSAASGIPVYRDAEGNWLRNNPIQHQDFINSAASRQRYWARSMVGWPRMAIAQPNEGHTALVTLERTGLIELLVTQNVDCLHQRAGQQKLIDLHGSLDRVLCLQCGRALPRTTMQEFLQDLNPGLEGELAEIRPDGDAELDDEQIGNLLVPPCPDCQGILMPDVVFFGGTVPTERVARVQQALLRADALLVVGSSLMVYSGFRFCKAAVAQNKPIAILNRGLTRADALATLKIEADCISALQHLQHALPSQ